MNKPLLESLRALNFPDKQYMVMGSGILEVLGIREAGDIDLVVSDDLYEALRSRRGWEQEVASNGAARLAHGNFQVYDSWFDENEVKKLGQLLLDAQWVDGVAFNSLQRLAFYKSRRGQPKDLRDLELIGQYLSS